MNAQVAFLADLTVALVVAYVGGWIASRLRLSPILGYLAAGIVIGPFTPGYVATHDTIENLAELGLIFLLFSIGLGFSFDEVLEAGWKVVAGTLVTTAALGAVFAGLAALFGLPHPLTLAIAAVVSSTAVGVALLEQWRVAGERLGRVVLALLVVQDLASVTLLIVVSTPAASLSIAGIAFPLVKAVIFVAVALVLGATLLRQFVVRLLRNAPTDGVFGGFTALALVAAWAGYAVGLSFDFGAFVAGAVISEAAGSRMVQSVVTPFRALFVALFFVAMGTLLDPKQVLAQWTTVLVVGVVFVAVRFGAWAALTRLLGVRGAALTFVGLAMVPLGEFNVVLANAAAEAHRLTGAERSLLIAVTFLSIAVATGLAPLLRRAGTPSFVIAGLRHRPAQRDPAVLIVGYGRVGRTAGNVLRELRIAFTALDAETAAIEAARQDGVDAVLGDATDPATLDRLVGRGTRVVLVTADGAANASIVHRLHANNPDATIVARAANRAGLAALTEAGAARVIVPEDEGALLFAHALLRALRVDERRIDRALTAERRAAEAAAG